MKRILLILLLLSGNCYASFTRSLVSWWKLNDNAATTTVVDSAGSNNGTFSDAGGDSNTDAHSTVGKVNGALIFDGIDDFVALPITDPFNTTFTVSLWFNINDVSGARAIFTASRGNSADERLVIYLFDKQILARNDGTMFLTGPVISAGEWHYITVAIDMSSTAILYVDGVLENTDVSPGSNPGTATDIVRIGINADGVSVFAGDIDNVSIFNKVLTAKEVKYLYNGGKGREELGQRDIRGRYSENVRTRYNIN